MITSPDVDASSQPSFGNSRRENDQEKYGLVGFRCNNGAEGRSFWIVNWATESLPLGRSVLDTRWEGGGYFPAPPKKERKRKENKKDKRKRGEKRIKNKSKEKERKKELRASEAP
jgi:hypothetical protein